MGAEDAPTAFKKFTALVSEILDLADFNMPVSLEEYGTCIQQWCPIIPEDQLRGREHELSVESEPPQRSSQPLTWLAMWLVTRQTCTARQHLSHCELYRALKQILALLQSRNEIDLEVLQLGVLIGVYEVGHAMPRSAHQTLASSAALLRLLKIDMRNQKDARGIKTVQWLEASMLMIDRMIPISVVSHSLPLLILSSDPISRATASNIGSIIPEHPTIPHANSPRKVHIRSIVALATGHVLEYIHSRRHELQPDETYDQVNDIISDCIKILVDKPEPHTWTHCDAIAMAFCSHLLLQQTEMDHHSENMIHFAVPNPEYAKTHVALKFSRHMAWDMVRVAIQKVVTESEIKSLPFAGLCCVLRAGIAVLETREYIDQDVVADEEVQKFVQILQWFGARWAIGQDYLRRVESILGREYTKALG